MSEEDHINDFLLDQELAPDEIPSESDLPDDIDAILDAVEDEDISVMPKAEQRETSINDFLTDDMQSDDFMSSGGLDEEVNIAAGGRHDDSIPVINDVIDPNHPPAQSGSTMVTFSEDMMFEIMAKIQHVVEKSVNKEIGKLATTVRDNVVEDVKNQLPGVLSKVLKGR